MNPLWSGVAFAGHVATAGSGAANAAYYAHRGVTAHGPRRLGALLLALLFAAITLDAIASLVLGEPSAVDALLRAPLLLANVAIGLVIVAGAGR